MSNRPLPLTAALSGAASVVLLFVGQAVGGGSSGPGLSSSRAEVAAWLPKQHASAAQYAGGMLELLGILALVIFAATLWSVLRAGDDGSVPAATAFGAGLLSAAIKLASVPAVFAVLWRREQGIDPQLATALLDMNNVSWVLTWAVDALMLGAAAGAILQRGVLPRWLGLLAAAAAVILLLSTPVANHVPPLGVLLTFAWMIATSVVLARRRLRSAPFAAVAEA